MSDIEKAGKGPFALIYKPDWKIWGDRHHTPCIMPHVWPWDVELPEGWAVLPLIWPVAEKPKYGKGPHEVVMESAQIKYLWARLSPYEREAFLDWTASILTEDAAAEDASEAVSGALEALTELAQGKLPPDSDVDPVARELATEAGLKDRAYKLVDLIESHADYQDILEAARELYHDLPDGGGQ
jgi:hypothetical protein